MKEESYVKFINNDSKCETIEKYDIVQEKENISWKDLFTDKIKVKKDEFLIPGFNLRSKDKWRIYSHSNNSIICKKGRSLNAGIDFIKVIKPNKVINFPIKDVLPDKYLSAEFNDDCGILNPSAYNYSNVFLDIKNSTAKQLKFDMQPFKKAFSDDFFILGLRDVPWHGDSVIERSGQMHKFTSEGDFLWGVEFNEEVDLPMFGKQKVTPYSIDIINENKNILVTSFGFCYNFDTDGNLIAKIDVTDLDSAISLDFSYNIDTENNLSLKVDFKETDSINNKRSILGGDMTAHFINRKPIFDNKNKQIIFIEYYGRISSWSLDGKLLWENKLDIKMDAFFDFIDDMLLIINEEGLGYWIDHNGKILSTNKYPYIPKKIFCIPDKKKYVFAKKGCCTSFHEHDFYDFDKTTHRIISEDNYKTFNDIEIEDIFYFDGFVVVQDSKGFLWTDISDLIW